MYLFLLLTINEKSPAELLRTMLSPLYIKQTASCSQLLTPVQIFTEEGLMFHIVMF